MTKLTQQQVKEVDNLIEKAIKAMSEKFEERIATLDGERCFNRGNSKIKERIK
jgi:hypothetical protein